MRNVFERIRVKRKSGLEEKNDNERFGKKKKGKGEFKKNSKL